MAPFPRDSDDDPEDIFAQNNDDEDDEYMPEDMENVIVLDENDEEPGLDEAIDDLDFQDIPEDVENGFIPDDSKMIFQQHDGSVFCLAISPANKDLLLTGGEDDKGFLTNTTNGESVAELGSHKDSVTNCGFNSDGSLLMTADMAGMVIVRKTDDRSLVWEFDCGDLEWCKWHPKANVVFGGTVEGDIYMWKIPSGECKIYQTNGSKTNCSALSASGKELFAGYEDGSVKLWDLKAGTAKFHYEGNAEDSVLCVAAQSTGNLFACGLLSGAVRLFNESGKLLVTFQSTKGQMEDGDEVSIECLSFSNDDHYLAAASLDSTMVVWDLATQRVRYECKHPTGVSHTVWLQNSRILTASLDGILRTWNIGTGDMLKEYQGHRGHILDLCVFNDDKFVMTAGDDGTSRLFEL